MSLITPEVDFSNLQMSDRMLIDSMGLNTDEASKMVKLFLDHETSWDSPDVNNGGKLKLHDIFTKGNKVTLSNFVANRTVNMSAKDIGGNTPLHYLATNKSNGIVQSLKNIPLDVFNVHIQNEKHETALHIAALHGNPGMLQFLLENGSDANAAANDGRTPIHYAVKVELPIDNRVDCVSLLMLYGADVEIIIGGTSVLDDIMFCTPDDDDDDYDFSLETMSKSNPLDLLDPVLTKLVIDEAIGKPIHSHIRVMMTMFSNDEFFNLKAVYELFKKELYATKVYKIFENVTLFEILTDEKSLEKIAENVQKPEDMLRLQEECCKFNLRPYHQDYILKKRFTDAMKSVDSSR